MMIHTTFIQKVADYLRTCAETKKNYLCYLDFAEFKTVNHHYGYDKGNALLHSTVEYVRGLPGVKHCERIFADHILFLVSRDQDQNDDALLQEFSCYNATLIKSLIAQYPACKHRPCCGIARIAGDNVMESIDLANMARLKAKRDFANTCHLVLDSDRKNLLQQMNLEQDVMLSLRKKQFVFYLQPKVDLLTGQVIGAEALQDAWTKAARSFIRISSSVFWKRTAPSLIWISLLLNRYANT